VEPNRAKLNRFIGPPLHESFQVFYGFSQEDSVRAVEVYREYYAEHGIYQICVYRGMDSLLRRLKMSGKRIILATSKYELYAVQILENIGFSAFFDLVAGSLKDGVRGTKSEVIEYALERTGADKKSAVMVGDRMHDTAGACAVGIDSIGVLFGYGTEKELLSGGATHIASTPDEIFEIVCRKEQS